MRNLILSFIIMGLLISASSCDQTDRETGHVVARDGEPAVHMVSGEDPDMNSAIRQARATVDTFIASLQNPAQNQTHFSVKAQIVDGVHSEHMWLYDVSFDGNQFQGKIGNNPLNVANVSLGDDFVLKPSEISDWMIIEDNRLVGGYTIRVLRNGLSGEELKKFDESLPFKVD
jgi:uncharacterized protein YegJ (DUF2314 family)